MKKDKKTAGARRSVRRRWLFSYFLVMMIPIICSVAAYFGSYSRISQEITAANSLSLVSAQSAIDSRLKKMQDMSVSVLRDRRFRELALMRNTQRERHWKVGEFITQLFTYRASSMNMDILIYFPELDYAITPEVAHTLDLLCGSIRYARNVDITTEQWRASILAIEPNTFSVSPEFSYTHYGTDAFVFSSNLSTLYQPGCYEAKVFVAMKPEEILPEIALHDEAALLVLNSQGDVLYAHDAEFNGTRLEIDMNGEQYQVVTIDGAKYACMFSASNAADFVYAVVTPYNLFWSRSYYINTIMAIGLIAASVIGITVSLRLLALNYTPLRSTLASLPGGGDESRNEFDRINEHLSLLYNAQNTMRVNLTRQQQYIKEYYLGMLLQGNALSLSDDDIIESLELDLTGKRLVPAFISIENEDDWAVMQSSYKDTDAAQKSVSLSAAIENIFRQMLPGGIDTLKTRSEDMIIIVCIASADDRGVIMNGIEKALEDTCDYFQKNLKMRLRAVVGTEAQSMEELPAIYRQVFPLGSFHTSGLGSGRVMRAERYVIPTNSLADRAESFLSLLYDAIKLHAAGDARDILYTLFRELDASGDPPVVKRFFLFELANRLYGAAGRLDAKHGKDSPLPDLLESILRAGSPDELYSAFEEYIRFLSDSDEGDNADSESSGRVRLHLRVQAYVLEHYADSNLNLAQIAQSVGMSPQYVSKLYKLETGQGLLDFINTVRIARAKEILAEEQIAINDLAPRVGYTNVKTFRRAFQKIEGANPGTFKG